MIMNANHEAMVREDERARIIAELRKDAEYWRQTRLLAASFGPSIQARIFGIEGSIRTIQLRVK